MGLLSFLGLKPRAVNDNDGIAVEERALLLAAAISAMNSGVRCCILYGWDEEKETAVSLTARIGEIVPRISTVDETAFEDLIDDCRAWVNRVRSRIMRADQPLN